MILEDLAIDRFDELQPVCADDETLLVRARARDGDARCLLKLPRDERPTTAVKAQLERAFDHARRAACAQVLAARERWQDGERVVVQFEDFAGRPLAELLPLRGDDAALVVRIGLEVARALSQVHAHSLVHCRVNPMNVLVDLDTGAVKLTGFGQSLSSGERQAAREFHWISGARETLNYIAPEQTGRINREIDGRADFYGLGATLYHILVGRPPFQTAGAHLDPLELLHAHIARAPVAVLEANPRVHETLAAIVEKLLAKDADQRYQSCFGLTRDLERLLARPRERFDLGQDDGSEVLRLPQRLYGRDTELAVLGRFLTAAAGDAALVLITGAPGVGKTSLVEELEARTARDCRFAKGKFDRFGRTTPYSAFVTALDGLIRESLAGSDAAVEIIERQLVEALGPNAAVVVPLIPSIELLLGRQPDQPDLEGTERRLRLEAGLRGVLRVFAGAEASLVLYLDDLQWADPSSLRLVRALLSGDPLPGLRLIGSYRDSEVGVDHPLAHLIDALTEEHTITRIELSPLPTAALVHYLADTFDESPAAVTTLAEICAQKTDGNPFFLRQFLIELADSDGVVFDNVERRWQVDLDRISALEITENVVDLMMRRIQLLSAACRDALSRAAYLGQRFELGTLAEVCAQPIEAVLLALESAREAGLIAALDQRHRVASVAPEEAAGSTFTFTHDRVRDAAYDQIPEGERAALHRLIGGVLERHLGDDVGSAALFECVQHLNLGALPDDDPVEIAERNFLAGQGAQREAAFEVAMEFFAMGVERLGDEGWAENYRLAYDLHLSAAQSRYQTGDYEATRELAAIARGKATSSIDRARIVEVDVLCAIAEHDSLGAVKLGLQGLAMLGERFPARPGNLHLLRESWRTRLAIALRRPQRALGNPPVEDAHVLAVDRLLGLVISASSFAQPRLLILIIYRLVRITLRHGQTPLSSFGWVSYAGLLSAQRGPVDEFYRFGQLGVAMADSDVAQSLAARSIWLYAHVVQHWKEPLDETFEYLEDAYERGIATGDPEYTAYAAFALSLHNWCKGLPLNELAAVLERDMVSIEATGQTTVIQWQRVYSQVVANLRGAGDAPHVVAGDFFQPDDSGAGADTYAGLDFHFQITSMILGLLFDQVDDAAKASARAARSMRVNFVASPCITLFYFYRGLIDLARAAQAEGRDRRRLLKRARGDRKLMRRWADSVPETNGHRALLLDAELARVEGRRAEARDLYDKAIAQAQRNRFVHEEALACELAARFHLGHRERRTASFYLREARLLWSRWQATAKVADLESRFPDLLTSTDLAADVPTASLDLATLGKATRAITEITALREALDRTLGIAMENAGAEQGFLFLIDDGALRLEAASAMSDSERAGLAAGALENQLAMSIVRYVARSADSVLLDDASQARRFETDPYVSAASPRSVLCLPLTYKGDVIGVLYLENDLTSGAFTASHFEILTLLAAQMAVSIDNARLYDNVTSLLDEVTDVKNYSESILGSMSNGVISFDEASRVTTHNEAASRLFGVENDELNGSTLAAPLFEQNAWLTRIMETLASDGRPGFAADCPLVGRDGVERAIVNATTLPLKSARNELIGGLLVLEDLSEEKRLKTTFGRYLSSEVVDEVLSRGGLRIGGEEREVTFLVSDLRGFSVLSNELPPDLVIAQLNRYLERMVDVILGHRGTVDEFQGDGILAFFGAPVSGSDDAERAVACGIDMMRALEQLNADFQAEGMPRLSMGIGINTGRAIVGNIGSERRAKYGAVGSAINTTYRIESFTVGGQILISDSTRAQLGDKLITGDELSVELKGAGEPITLHELLGVGGAYATELPQSAEPPLTPVVETHVVCFPLEGKIVAESAIPARLDRFSRARTYLATAAELEALTNLKIEFDQRQSAVPPAYAKVVGRHGTQTEVQFTWLPTETENYLRSRRATDQTQGEIDS